MKKAVLIVIVLTAIMILPGCRKRDQTAGAGKAEPAYPFTIETVDGVKTVRNPEFPKEGVVRYALQEELTIGGESGGTESVLNRPLDLKLDSQGNIYVMDWGDVEIKVFGPDGQILRTIGKKGQGIYLRQVRVPQTLFLVRADKAYSIIRTEEEYFVVKRFRMVKAEEPTN